MGQTNLTDYFKVIKLPPDQELELKKVNKEGDTSVSISGRFIAYIKWEQADDFARDMVETYSKYFKMSE